MGAFYLSMCFASVAGFGCLVFFTLACYGDFHFTQDNIEHRGEDQAEDGDADHATEDRDADGLAHLCTSAVADDEGEDAHDKGDGCHEDWT